MALLAPHFLDTTVALGMRAISVTGGVDWIASGFLLGKCMRMESEKAGWYSLFLVTNRHVVDACQQLLVAFNRSQDEPSVDVPVPPTALPARAAWTVHPDPDVDVAVTALDKAYLDQFGVRPVFFKSPNDVWTRADMDKGGVSEGDGVYVLGFPMGLVTPGFRYVVARSGTIARVRDALKKGAKTYLIDAHVFPGNSGGPITLKPEITSVSGTKAIPRSYLIGMVTRYVPWEDVAVSQQTRRPRVVFTENSGLAEVVVMDHVIEAIDCHLSANPPQEDGGTA